MKFRSLILAFALGISFLTPAWAVDSNEREQAIRALEVGEIMTLQKMLQLYTLYLDAAKLQM